MLFRGGSAKWLVVLEGPGVFYVGVVLLLWFCSGTSLFLVVFQYGSGSPALQWSGTILEVFTRVYLLESSPAA